MGILAPGVLALPISANLWWQAHLKADAAHAAQAHQHQVEAVAREHFKDLMLQALRMQRDQAQARATDAEAKLADTQTQLNQQKAENADLKAENAVLKARVFSTFSLSPAPAGTPTGGSVAIAAGNRFAPGYCTWYVFNLRQVPWLGNAIEWWGNARAYAAEGYTPKPGAIMVTRDSWYGHVALVTSVVGDGTWWVREMNFTCGLWCEDFRLVRPGGSLVGFIY